MTKSPLRYLKEESLQKIGFRRKEFYLGSFKRIQDAQKVYNEALKNVRANKEPDMCISNKLRTSNYKPVVQKNLSGKVIRIYSSLSAARRDGYLPVGIWRYTSGKCKHYKKSLWEYM